MTLSHLPSHPPESVLSFSPRTITEFGLLRKQVKLEEPAVNSGGFRLTHLRVKFWVERTSTYYVLKAFMPLYILTAVSFLTEPALEMVVPGRTSKSKRICSSIMFSLLIY